MPDSSIQHDTVLSATAEGSVPKLLCLCKGHLILPHISKNRNISNTHYYKKKKKSINLAMISRFPNMHSTSQPIPISSFWRKHSIRKMMGFCRQGSMRTWSNLGDEPLLRGMLNFWVNEVKLLVMRLYENNDKYLWR